MNSSKKTFANAAVVHIACILLCIAVFYSNSMNASWHLDDYSNILMNPKIQIRSLEFSEISQALHADIDRPGKLYRPVATLTLALNWYFGQQNVVGYHAVNLIVHAVTALFLYFAVIEIMRSPALSRNNSRIGAIVALLTTLFWALNPIQTQAVTYIVQRMAAMAAMFYIMAIFLYLRARNTPGGRQRFWLLAACTVAFLLAVGSKENAVMFPVSIILIEWCFYDHLVSAFNRGKTYRILSIGLFVSAVVICGAYFALFERKLDFILQGYEGRPFTLEERVLTEPRVIILYLTQLVYPIPARLSLTHDIDLSQSLTDPITTLLSIVLIGALILMAILVRKRLPLLTFAICFYFLNHIVESTVIPLEIMFEHRNYLPSLFFFLPASYYLVAWITKKRDQGKTGFANILRGGIFMVILLLGFGTYVRNMTWQSEKSLWEDEINKNPHLARPYSALAYGYLQPTGQHEKALAFYQKAMTLKQHSRNETVQLKNNLARSYYLVGDYPNALQILETLVGSYPTFYKARMQLIMTLIQMDRIEAAQMMFDDMPSEQKRFNDAQHIQGVLLVNQKQYVEAMEQFRKNVKNQHFPAEAVLFLGALKGLSGDLDTGWQYYESMQDNPNYLPITMLGKVDNRIKANALEAADELLAQYLEMVGTGEGLAVLTRLKDDRLAVPLNYAGIISRSRSRIED